MSDEFNDQVVCPTCGEGYQHAEEITRIDGDDYYKAGWAGRGDLFVIRFQGECGHNWQLCYGFHKGNTYRFTRQLPDREEDPCAE